MKQPLLLFLGIVLAHGTSLHALEQHHFIVRLCAQIESQLQTLDRAIGKLKTAIIDKQIQVSDQQIVLQSLAHAQDTTRKALHSSHGLGTKKFFLLPTYLETAFERTIDRWIKEPALVPSATEIHLISHYADSLTNVLSYLRATDKKSLELSLISTKSIFLTLFSHCVVNSIILSLYTLKTKRLVNRVLQRLYLLNALLEEYHKKETPFSKDPSAQKAISSYSTWTQDVIQRIISSEISVNNPQHEELWRPKVPAAINRVTSSLYLGKKTMLDRVLGYIVNQITNLTLTDPCFDYISSLVRCIRECAQEVPL
ncbi:hypothetical protein H0W26_01230 [Candidatus Dependentiae bacterium]|nr:hypothetical protein [Candidatus Dependentiae bacterium]